MLVRHLFSVPKHDNGLFRVFHFSEDCLLDTLYAVLLVDD